MITFDFDKLKCTNYNITIIGKYTQNTFSSFNLKIVQSKVVNLTINIKLAESTAFNVLHLDTKGVEFTTGKTHDFMSAIVKEYASSMDTLNTVSKTIKINFVHNTFFFDCNDFYCKYKETIHIYNSKMKICIVGSYSGEPDVS